MRLRLRLIYYCPWRAVGESEDWGRAKIEPAAGRALVVGVGVVCLSEAGSGSKRRNDNSGKGKREKGKGQYVGYSSELRRLKSQREIMLFQITPPSQPTDPITKCRPNLCHD